MSLFIKHPDGRKEPLFIGAVVPAGCCVVQEEDSTRRDTQTVIFEVKPDERVIGICQYHDCILLTTDVRLYRIENADSDELMTTHIEAYTRAWGSRYDLPKV